MARDPRDDIDALRERIQAGERDVGADVVIWGRPEALAEPDLRTLLPPLRQQPGLR